MSTPKTNLLVPAPQPNFLLSFNHHNREVLRITPDGRLVTGEGLSADEATQEAAKLLIASFEAEIKKMVEKRIAAERETTKQLRSELNYAKVSEELYHDEGTQLREKVRVLREALALAAESGELTGWYFQQARAALAATKEDSP